MKFLLGAIFVSFLVGPSAWGYRPPSDEVKSLSDASIYNECVWNKEILESTLERVDCNDLYNHYEASSGKYKPTHELRMGSYNIFRSYEQQQKRWDLTAEMINSEWDILALSELQPNKSSFLQANVNAILAYRKGKISKQQLRESYLKPSYITLLLELRKRDPSWSLIISPYSQSDYDTELFGFLYRNRRVKILESNYCRQEYLGSATIAAPFIYQEIKAVEFLPGIANSSGFVKSNDGRPVNDREFIAPKKALGCVLKLSPFGQKNIPKVPFVARFESGKFDFSYLSLHLGFRGPKEARIEGKSGSHCLDACQEHTNLVLSKILKTFSRESAKEEIDKIFASIERFGLTASRKIIRFFQLHETIEATRRIRLAEGDADLIIGGDFNLEPNDWSWQGLMWAHIEERFGRGQVLVDSKTTLSRKNGFASRYDHFILSTESGDTDECHLGAKKAKRFNFVGRSTKLASGFPLADELRKYSYKKYFSEIVNKTIERLTKVSWVTSKGNILSTEELSKAIVDEDSSELRALQMSTKKWCDGDSYMDGRFRDIFPDVIASETYCKLQSDRPYEKYLAAMSDHVPISMTCSTELGDSKP